MNRIIVFGADGFIGRHLVKGLVNNPSNQVIAFDRFSNYRNGQHHVFQDNNNVEMAVGDFFNRNDLYSVIKKGDVVFHLVSSTNPANSNDDPFIDIETNIRSSVELFQICAEKKVKKIVFFSSGGTVYGDIDSNSISEEVATKPRSPYGIGKLTIENYLRYFKFVHGLDYIVYRIANPYGPGQNIFGNQGVIPIFIYKSIKNEPVTIFGDGNMMRDYIYINDLIDSIIKSFSLDNKYSEYNIGSSTGTTINEIVSAIEKSSNSPLRKKHLPVPSTYVDKIILDTSRFTHEFGTIVNTSLGDGITKTIDYVKKIN